MFYFGNGSITYAIPMQHLCNTYPKMFHFTLRQIYLESYANVTKINKKYAGACIYQKKLYLCSGFGRKLSFLSNFSEKIFYIVLCNTIYRNSSA